MRFRKPQLIPLLFIIIAFTTLFGLGAWQVERLQWKNNLVKDIELGQAQPALGTLPQEIGGLDYRKVALTGTFMHDKAMHMVGHPQGAGPGFYIITPFTLEDDGRVILVNRGYSPKDKESKPEGMQTVEGIIRPIRIQRMFSPENFPDKNVWFYEDVPAMAKTAGVELTPIVVEEVGPAQKDVYPTPSDGKISLRNDHLGYAITWFSLALISLVMFAIYHREQDKPTQA